MSTLFPIEKPQNCSIDTANLALTDDCNDVGAIIIEEHMRQSIILCAPDQSDLTDPREDGKRTIVKSAIPPEEYAQRPHYSIRTCIRSCSVFSLKNFVKLFCLRDSEIAKLSSH